MPDFHVHSNLLLLVYGSLTLPLEYLQMLSCLLLLWGTTLKEKRNWICLWVIYYLLMQICHRCLLVLLLSLFGPHLLCNCKYQQLMVTFQPSNLDFWRMILIYLFAPPVHIKVSLISFIYLLFSVASCFVTCCNMTSCMQPHLHPLNQILLWVRQQLVLFHQSRPPRSFSIALLSPRPSCINDVDITTTSLIKLIV